MVVKQVEVSHGPIQEANAYMSRLDLRQLPEAATYCGVGPPLPPDSDTETQVTWYSTTHCNIHNLVRRMLPEAATYYGVRPPLPPESDAETQVVCLSETWSCYLHRRRSV